MAVFFGCVRTLFTAASKRLFKYRKIPRKFSYIFYIVFLHDGEKLKAAKGNKQGLTVLCETVLCEMVLCEMVLCETVLCETVLCEMVLFETATIAPNTFWRPNPEN